MIGRFLGVSLTSQLKGAVRPLLITLIMFILILQVGAWLNPLVSQINWFSLTFFVGLTVLIVTAAAFFLGLTRDQQRGVFDRVRKVLKGSSK